MIRTRTLLPILCSLLLISPVWAQTPAAKKPLDHDVYGFWHRIVNQSLSADGAWASYFVEADSIDGVRHLQSLTANVTHRVERATPASITDDSRFVVFLIKPQRAAVEQAKKEKKKPDEQPQDSLGILDLTTGAVTKFERVKGFKLPRRSGEFVAWQLAKAPAAKSDSARSTKPDSAKAEPGAKPTDEKKNKEPKRDEGTTLVLRALADGTERRIDDVVWYDFSEDGARLVYHRSNTDGSADGVYALDTRTGTTTTLLAGKGNYKAVVIERAGRQVAFLSNTASFTAEQPEYTLYLWDGKATSARPIASSATAGLPQGWWVSEHGAVTFSESGARVFFGTAPRPEPEPEQEEAEGEVKVVVDIWHWQDPLLQPMQLKQLEREQRRTYQAMFDVRAGRLVQLATTEVPEVDVADRGDGAVALGRSDLPYRKATSWGEGGTDYYLIDVRTGQAVRIIENLMGGGFGSSARLSPEGRWVTWYNAGEQQWFALDTRTRQARVISSDVPHPLYDEQHDTPSLPGAYGTAGWTRGDELFLVYDAHDIWALDPTGRQPARCITEEQGRRENLRFRYVRLDPEERAIDPAADLTLSAFQLWTKQQGFYRDRVNGNAAPTRLLLADKSFGTPTRARRAGTLLLTREDFTEYPDLWVSDESFNRMTRISNAEPKQAEYLWGTAELVSWRSGDGELLQGVLYKPENFDSSKKYPMIVYFYERLSDEIHSYMSPNAGSSSINTSFYVSRGYLVFRPDIPYRVGYPGESAYRAVVPGVIAMIDRGFVDEKRIGVQGHSWGGYQIAYLVTKTNIFAAAEAGAPVSNMVSAYGGIRWGTGMVRQFQYEKTQSRIGGTLWEAPLHFIENSPIFWADKVETPLLMMHNDQDGAVPWEQGIEYFVALRRLNKPAWLLNYNGEDHGLQKAQNRRDWTIRMQQFFDHYLKDAPAPVWLAEGVPAIRKGRTLGLELVTSPRPERPVTQQ